MKNLILLVFLFFAGCGTLSEQLSIVDKSSCKLPCWNGIIAGQTTESELLEIFENSPDIDQDSIQNANRPWDIFDNQIFFSFQPHSKMDGEARISDNTVSDLILCGELHISIGDLVQEIGEPETIISGNNIGGGRTIILTDPQHGISYWYTTSLNNLEITSDTPIDCVKIFNPSLYEEMLEAGFFSGGYYGAQETLKVMYPWDGYGNLDEKYPPRQP